jgi:D-sedoheptulose 7-phosphate isomerase
MISPKYFSDKMKEKIKKIIEDSISVKQAVIKSEIEVISQIANAVIACLKNNGKIIIFGNGGSCADSQHMAAELVARFQKERKAFAAIALTADTPVLTAVGNDYGFDFIFSRQIEALGKPNDLAIAISTSGNSKNVIKAIQKATEVKVKTVCLTGGSGGKLAKITDISLIVPSNNTARIQEAHICILHAICEIVEEKLLEK